MASITGLSMWDSKRQDIGSMASNMRGRVGGPRQGVCRTAGAPLGIQGHPKKTRKQTLQRHHHHPINASIRSTAPGDPGVGCLGSHLRKIRVQVSTLTLLLAVLQMLQRLCGRVQEEVRALRLCPLEPVQDELLYARDLIKDAKNSRAVSPP